MAEGWETALNRRIGSALQAGIPSPERRPSSLEGSPLGYVCEAVVLALYWPEEDTTVVAGKQVGLTADVRTISMNPREFSRVRVLQPRHGIHDEDLWTPRPASVTTDGSALVATPSGTSGTGSQPTRAENCDGEHVLLIFLENSIAKPAILPISAPHPSVNRLLQKSDGHVRRIRHNGTLVQWDAKGNLTIDAREAAYTALGSKAAEVSASGDGGEITIKTKDGSGHVSSVLLDKSGNVILTDGGGNTLILRQAGNKIELDSGEATVDATGDITLTGGGTVKMQSSGIISVASDATVQAASGSNAAVKTANAASGYGGAKIAGQPAGYAKVAFGNSQVLAESWNDQQGKPQTYTGAVEIVEILHAVVKEMRTLASDKDTFFKWDTMLGKIKGTL